jgi:glyoxylase I family protein
VDTALVAVDCFSHLGVTVSDLDAARAFYTEVLGFVPAYEDVNDDWTRVGLVCGDVVLELFSERDGQPPNPPDPFYVAPYGRPKIALTVVDVDASYRALSEAGIPALCAVTTTSVSRFFMIADPDGTPIQLHEFSGGRRRLAELFG